MTVSELIEELKKYSGDMPVGVYGEYDLGFIKSVQVSTTMELSDDDGSLKMDKHIFLELLPEIL